MQRIRSSVLALVATACGISALPAAAQQVNVEEFVLENGMKFLLYPRDEEPNIIAAGWVAKVGSVNERPGITGISHFFEHMMFKGTRTIGTADAARDEEYRRLQKETRDKLMELQHGLQYERFRRGEIDDPWNPANDTREVRELRAQLEKLIQDHREVIVKDEFDRVYTTLGGSSMNAFTTNDLTFYFISVPANKFELWAWMESDRLIDSVFREFYAERDVVHEERRLRTESTPTGIFDEQLDAIFWQSSPYKWPVIGWPSDLNSYTLEQAQDYYATYYQPANLVGVVVGDFEPAEIKPVIQQYFSRLTPTGKVIPPVVTLEMPQTVEKRMYAECDCQPQVQVRYHTVPFNHPDEFALEMMSNVLNGRTGRLYKSMIEGKEIASSAFAAQDARKYAGMYSFYAETKGEATPEQLESAWYEEIKRLQDELVPEQELQKVKNQVAADSYRRLQNSFFLMVQIGYSEGLGDWRYINESPKKLQAVTAEDIRRVARKYFDRWNRTVAIYTRKAGTGMPEDEDPELAALDKLGPQVKQSVKKQVEQIQKNENLDELRVLQAEMTAQKDQVPEHFKPALDYFLKKLAQRIAELEAKADSE